MKNIALLGSTGSIGTQTLDVVRASQDKFNIEVLAAGSSIGAIRKQITEFSPSTVIMSDVRAAKMLDEEFSTITVLSGPDALKESVVACDIVVNAIVGFAGLPVTIAALSEGKTLALANKESLIAGGPVVQKARKSMKSSIIPVDSEHSALYQCLHGYRSDYDRPSQSVRRLILTASGGPFRGFTTDKLNNVTFEEALEHPTWDMGPKITVDSSTLMNKGLEVIEAHELFGIEYEKIDVVVHPQSIVHSMVEFVDSSTIAQLSMPDMRLPITYALNYPERSEAEWGSINWDEITKLEFEQPDFENFSCLKLAYQAGEEGETAPAWLNAANEVAVAAFLNGQIKWADIPHLIAQALDNYDSRKAEEEHDIYEADKQARLITNQLIAGI
jgi:1-deoxy-D-xylulose-5-phosphate reductoisomerase